MVQDIAQASAAPGKRSVSNKLSTSPSKRKTPESLRSSAASFNSSINEIPFPQQNPQSTTSKPIVTYSARDRKRTRSGNDGRPDQFDKQTSLRKRAASNDSPARTLPQTLNSQSYTSSSASTRKTAIDGNSGTEMLLKENPILTNRQSAPPSSTRRKRSDSSFILVIDSNAYSSHRSKPKSTGTEAKGKQKEKTPAASTSLKSPAPVIEHDRESNSSGNDEDTATTNKTRFVRESGGRSPESDSDKQKPNSSLPSTSQAPPQLPTPSPDVDIKPFESSPKLPIFATVSRPRLSRLSQAELHRRVKVDAGKQSADKLAPTKDKSIAASTQAESPPTSTGAASFSAASPALVDSPSLASHLLSFDSDFIFATRDSSADLRLDFLAPLFSQLHYDTVPNLRRLKPRDSSLVIRKLKSKYEEGGMKEGIVEELDWERMEERLRDGFGRE